MKRALSRSSGKSKNGQEVKRKILHVDGNDFYGGTEAALSLQEARVWVDGIAKGMFRMT